MVSVKKVEKVLKLTNTKFLGDGSVLKKIEEFSKQGVEKGFFKDGQKLGGVIPRLNRENDA